ncbi:MULTISPECIES: STAS domain-containing protein [Polaromonas]|uniref:STAS domain-containing protein n=1 Tax=Polaromonas aquatica TaxID=332657 RepID=A0ABW1U199_9BURK
MSKEDTSSGLLSKVVKFVRNPATSWSDLDTKETDRDEALSKQLLKEMIERKRRNDFVRKREFDMLRKMRKREALVGQDPTARPSFFQSSMPSKPDDRANTLKKIDEIEAQMSMQWWKTKQGTSSTDSVSSSSYAPSSRTPVSGGQPPVSTHVPLPAGYASTEPVGLSHAGDGAARKPASPPPSTTPAPQHRPMVANAPVQAARIGGLSGVGVNSDDSASSSFTPSRLMAVDVAEVAHDAELEEASIRFANGDDAGAEAGLLEMLAPGGSRTRHPETWMALFDLYRATAQQDKFETAAIQFVQIFDRSAPQWFSMPEMVHQLATLESKAAGNGPAADWICPSVVGIQTIAALKAALAKAPMPWRLDWSNLKTIDATAVDPLYKVFGSWSAQPVQLRFMGDAQLQQVLQKAAPSGQKDTGQEWWQLRMEVLRVTHRPDEFELAALDFCVTYEVSPPAWESARCEYKPLDQDGGAVTGHTFIGDVYRDSTHSGLSVLDGDTHMDGMNSQMGGFVSVELSGQVQGDAIAVLDQLEARVAGAEVMTIACAKLIRVDFSAAGTLLNWVSARQGENRAVQFSDVNRLVAAFFNVIGITEHARVVTRID